MILGLDHVHIFCGDVNASAKYFENMFGAKEVSRENVRGIPVRRVNVSGLTVTLMGSDATRQVLDVGKRSPGLDHFCFLVKDLEILAAEMRKKGALFSVEPHTVPNGAKIAFIKGPDGIEIELKEWPLD